MKTSTAILIGGAGVATCATGLAIIARDLGDPTGWREPGMPTPPREYVLEGVVVVGALATLTGAALATRNVLRKKRHR